MRCSARNLRDANNYKGRAWRFLVPHRQSVSKNERTSMALIPQRRNLLNVQAALTNFGNHVHALTRTAGYLDIEHNVNGVWNSILNICFPTDDMDFVINPEAYPLPIANMV